MIYQTIQRLRWFLPLFAGVLLGLVGCATPGRREVRNFTTVVLDAGHGGHDSGAISRTSRVKVKRRYVNVGPRIYEKNVALDVTRRVEKKLAGSGLRVVMTRADDRFIPLDSRVAISNQRRNSLFVSIHFNDSRKRHIQGAEVYHNAKGTDAFARRMVRSLADVPGVRNRGTKVAQFRVLRKSTGPAILIECGYLSNPAELARCASPEHRERLAGAIARTIIEQRR